MSLLIKETGLGVDNSNTYVDVSDVDLYCAKLGLSDWNKGGEKEKEQSIFRAMAYIESFVYQGYKVFSSSVYPLRKLKFPRYEIYDEDGYCLDYQVIPQQLIDAVCRAAYEELIDPGCLQINLTKDSFTKMEKIGSLQIEYSEQNQFTLYQALKAYLEPLLTPSGIKLLRV